MISIILFSLAGACKGLAELLAYDHQDSIFFARVKPESFWGAQSWKRKFRITSFGTLYPLPFPGMTRWHKLYYKFFKIRWQEKYLFSTTLFIWRTNGMNMCDVLMRFCLVCAVVVARWEDYSLALTLIFCWIGWSVGYTLARNVIFQRRQH